MSVNMSKLPRETGIYLITVKIGNSKHVYVGQSENMGYRQSKHLYDSIHRPKNSTIYPLFKGNEATFEVLEIMSGSTLPDRELKEAKYIRVFKEGDYIVHNRTDSGTGVKDKKPVDVYCYKTREYILTCDSVAEASIIYNVKHQNICACCSGIK